jgi:rod shape determining protein RodA
VVAPSRISFKSGPQIDMVLLVCCVAIATLGLVNLYSATSYYVEAGRKAGLADIYVSQVYWIVVGSLLAILCAVIDYRHYERLAYVFFAGGIVSLLLVFVLARDIRGSVRWISVGSFHFQPSEFIKILLVLALAKYLHNDQRMEPRRWVDLTVPLGLTAIPVTLVLVQPDLGTSLTYIFTAGSILSMVRIRRRSLFSAAVVVSVSAPLFWNYVLKGYQKARITSFLDPEHDITGTGWHALQSKTAIGNGGLTGCGFMQGTQNQFGFLPDQFSDFPFAVFAEDWGLLGCSLLIALYAFLCGWSIHIASQAKDRFGAALAVGIGALFFWHVVANVGMASGILPVVGITLPLFSYGGSSILTFMVGLGLLMNVSMRR